MKEIHELEKAGYQFSLTQQQDISFRKEAGTMQTHLSPATLLEKIKNKKDKAVEFLQWRQQIQAVVAVDIETTSLVPRRGHIRCISFSSATKTGVTTDLEKQRAVLANPSIMKVFHNAAFDVYFLEEKGFTVKNYTDSMIMAQVLSNNQGSHQLKDLAQSILGTKMEKELQESAEWNGELSYKHYLYSMKDAAVTRELTLALAHKIVGKELYAVLQREIKALPAIIRLQQDGMPFDKAAWQAELTVLVTKKDALENEILTTLGTEINLNSPKQLKQCLQNRGIPLRDTTDESLAALEVEYPVIAKIRLYRQYHKLSGLGGDKWMDYVQVDRFIYPSWRAIGATTGRMSCSQPNLQQVPHLLRPYFRAETGHCFIISDYSQIELRVAAEIAKDLEMMKAFNEGVDLHKKTASMILKKSTVDDRERQVAKTANFGLIFGMEAAGLQKRVKAQFNMNLSPKEATTFRNGFFRVYRNIKRYQEKQLQKSKIMTRGGRYWLDIPKFPHKGWRNRYNYEIQGTAAEGLKEALATLHPQLASTWKLCAVVHDEIVLHVPLEDANEAKKVLEESMVNGMKLLITQVPIEVSTSQVNVWGK